MKTPRRRKCKHGRRRNGRCPSKSRASVKRRVKRRAPKKSWFKKLFSW